MNSPTYVEGSKVTSPKDRVVFCEIILDDGEGKCVYALGTWDKEPCILFRWNGKKENKNGYPKSRFGHAQWIVLDKRFNGKLLEYLKEEQLKKAKQFLGLN
jgi:hypothetical protein